MLHNVLLCQHSFDFCNISTLCKIRPFHAKLPTLTSELNIELWNCNKTFPEVARSRSLQIFFRLSRAKKTNALRLFHSNKKSIANAQKIHSILFLLERSADTHEPSNSLGLWRIGFQRGRFKKVKI